MPYPDWFKSASMKRKATLSMGSSPRVRGTEANVVRCNGRIGIIPARAGNSLVIALLMLIRRDHPRACGEQRWPRSATAPHMGSSPRVRGTDEPYAGHLIHDGIIPARAGNSTPRQLCCRNNWDHPRACGEQSSNLPILCKAWGSSPRVRGTDRLMMRESRRCSSDSSSSSAPSTLR